MEAHRVAQQYRLIGPSVEQPQYNLFEREKLERDYLEVFKNVGLGTTVWSPLASGLLTGKYNQGIPAESRLGMEGFEWLKDRWMAEEKINKVKALGKIAERLNVSLPALSIGWCIKNPNVTTAILGATKKEQLLDNVKALEAKEKLTAEVMGEIELIMQTKPVLPEY
jgi:aryl-alcohol dehydrogenase-like predicted oxidoreductase